jgi:hypothetical protein
MRHQEIKWFNVRSASLLIYDIDHCFNHPIKLDVIYVDFQVPVLARMHGKRRASYKALGYEIELPQDDKTVQLTLVDL